MRAFYALTKPRVVSLIVFTAVIGMFLATPGMVPVQILLAATLGIAAVAGAAAAVNCLVEQKIDAVMQRTRARPLPRGELSSLQTLVFAGMLGGLGLWVLVHFVNPLTMWLTLATFVGYAIVYTVILKPMTPQNIVIGGASGAMPPVLGWAAVTGEVTTGALLRTGGIAPEAQLASTCKFIHGYSSQDPDTMQPTDPYPISTPWSASGTRLLRTSGTVACRCAHPASS